MQEAFSDSPFDGWIQALNCAIPLQTSQDGSDQRSSQKKETLTLHKLIEETSDKIIVEKLLQQEQSPEGHQGASKTGAAQSDAETGSSGPLDLIRDLCNGSVRHIDRSES